MPLKKLYLPCWLFIVCSIALVPAASAADAETPAPGASQSFQEQKAPAQTQEQQAEETLRKTTHGRSMLARDDGGDAESGRFMRALSACIGSYTGSSN